MASAPVFDTVIRGGTLITPQGRTVTDLGVAGEVIAAIGPDLQGRETIDARGKLVLPGAVDPHVHLQMPAGSIYSSDDWRSGTVAAACGGTTTVIDFVEPDLLTAGNDDEGGAHLLKALAARRAEAEGQAAIDFGLHMTVRQAYPAVLRQIPALVASGCSSFKTYLTYDGFRLNDAALLEVLAAVADAGGLVLVHAENDAGIRYLQRKLLAAGHTEPRYHPLSRPPALEAEAIRRAVALAGVTGCPLYVVHVSTAQGAAAIAEARGQGQRVYGETCPQYLLLTESEYQRPGFEGARYVCCPPLRPQDEAAALWQHLKAGALQTVGTDHCPFFFDGQKSLGAADFTAIPSGLPGIESRLALLYTYGVIQGRLSPEDWVRACCSAPAQLFGLYPRKGALVPGADADIVVFDPRRELVLSRRMLHEHCDYTPYEGYPIRGYPDLTLARGRVIAREGAFIGPEGHGRYLARQPMGETRWPIKPEP